MGTCSAVAMIVTALDVSGHSAPFLSLVLMSLMEFVRQNDVFQPKTLIYGGCNGAEGMVVMLVHSILNLQS